MPNFNNNIEIDKNSICYGNEVLKISNISRTWIFKFQNKEKKAYEEAMINYEIAKKNYESLERYKKNRDGKRYTIVCIMLAFLAVYLLSTTILGLLVLIISAICGFIAFRKFNKKINYPKDPPIEKKVPNKFGLGIQMNSGYLIAFTAEGSKGVHALKKLQDDIKDADVHNEKTVFNMNEYNVKIDGDVDGIVNFGDDNVNVNTGKELLNV